MANHNLQPVRSYGEAVIPLRFGFCPYGSTSAGTIQPFVPLVTRDPTFGPQPRWGGAVALHDGQFTGRYNILLDDDYPDLNVTRPQVRCNLNVTTPSLLFVSTTAGSGVRITGVQPGPGILATIPIVSVTAATGAGAGLCTVGISAGVITLTISSTTTNATVVTAINAATSTLGVTACTVGTATDVFYTTASTVFVFSQGCNNPDEFQASAALVSATSTIFMTYTANTAQASPITVIYLAGGAGTAASAALSVVAPNTVILTVDTSATIATVLTAINVTAVATVGALITAGFTTTGTTQANNATAAATVAISGTTQNLTGTVLTGGGLIEACYSGATVGDANTRTSQFGAQYFHLNVSVYKGDLLTDLSAASEAFIPSQGALNTIANANSGVLFQSVGTAAVAAKGTVYSNAPTNTHGLTFTAKQPGDAGNNIIIEFANPLATLFIPSTTAGSGNLFTAVATGTAGRGVQMSMSVPTGASTVISVNGSVINIQPKAAETVAGVTAAVIANAAAAALVTATSVGTTSDPVTGGFNPTNLNGGYTLGSTTVTFAVQANALGGSTIVVQFGGSATNATGYNAFNTAVTAGQVFPVTCAELSTTTDPLVAGPAVQLTGGTDPSDLSVQYTFVGSAATTAAFANSTVTVTIALAGDTNANIAAAVNSAAGNNSVVATVLGVGSDTNLPPTSTNVGFVSTGSQQLAPVGLVCHNSVEVTVLARNSINGVV